MNSSEEEDYEYDYDKTVSVIPLEELVPVSIVYSITLFLGVTGNSLVIFCILRYNRMRSITNILLLSLASADLLLVVICVPIKGVAFFSFTWTMGEVLCKAVHYLQNVSMLCSVFTLTVISIERYIAIRHPLKAKYICTLVHARLVIMGVWILSFIGSLPVLFGQLILIYGNTNISTPVFKPWVLLPNKRLILLISYGNVIKLTPVVWPVEGQAHTQTYTHTLSTLCYVYLVIPFTCTLRVLGYILSIFLFFSYFSMVNNGCIKDSSGSRTGFRSIYITGDRRRKKTTEEDDKTKMQVVKMLVVVVLLFIICWAPILINNVMIGFDYLPRLHYGYLKPMRMAFNLMAYFNSCINPIVYSFMSKNFREKFKHSFRTLFRGRFTGADRIWTQRGTVSFTTRTTSLNRSKLYSMKGPVEKDVSISSVTENCKIILVPD
ncbi:galanin receptor 2b-like [Octopus sinensis]|uniref:Galanin receptor 2b-like n=1 Tax=Octopus sinensis TaxID=2607531 RepID=A0A7E6F1B3_9MOLL|nr:galanin receptor 2b-like [Octopus sinensis]